MTAPVVCGDRVGSPGGTSGAHPWKVLGEWGALVTEGQGLGGVWREGLAGRACEWGGKVG